MISNEMIECIIETSFTEIILRVFNLILDKSQFPKIWKMGYIVPIFEGEDSFDPSNCTIPRLCSTYAMATIVV